MTGPPPARPSTTTPDGARGGQAKAWLKLQSCDGRRLIRRITQVQADYLIASGLGYKKRSGEIWLNDRASPSKGIARTWNGSAQSGHVRPVRYSHNDRVCAGYRPGSQP
jgi:hypothetical protein